MDLKKDMKKLKELVEKGTILWGEVIRVGRDPERHSYMMVNSTTKNVTSEYPCIIYRDEADAEFKSGSLMYLVGHRIPYTVIGVDEEKGRLLCSRKAAQEKTKLAMQQDLAEGKDMPGTILNFVSYGAYVEVNGVVGMLKNTDYSTDFSEISETKKEGDSITVKCKEVTSEGKIFWTVPQKVHREKPIQYDFEPNTAVLGTVQSIKNFANGVGVFVRIATGLDALCTIPQDLEIEVGARVSIRIVSVEDSKDEFAPPRVRGRVMRVV